MTPEIPFRRNVVEPVACIKGGWEIIKNQYWLFVGMTLVGVIIGGAVPIVLMGPMMCGLNLAFFKTRRGEPIEFGTLFKGFDYFGQSVIAAVLHTIPVIVIVIPAYILFYVFMFVGIAASSQGGGEPNPAALFGVMAGFGLFWLVVVAIIIIISIGFIFVYPLIVDRKLSAIDAIKLSFRAALSNFWRLLGMVLLTSLMTTVGVLACYVGAFLVMPIGYAAIAKAYEQVFGLDEGVGFSNMPPPPPVFN
ncbi:MAG TPA: hypothetical protein VKB05_19470 [Pyrinomonadaceae bacterium]|nr:hypothetical protein [Pyrinomonadaceae bacterium]